MMRTLVASLAFAAGASGLQTGARSAFRSGAKAAMSRVTEAASAAALAAVFTAVLVAPDAAQALSKDTINSLTYDQMKGTGLANKCPDAPSSMGNIVMGGKLDKFDEFCMQPTEVSIIEKSVDKKGNAREEIIPSKVEREEGGPARSGRRGRGGACVCGALLGAAPGAAALLRPPRWRRGATGWEQGAGLSLRVRGVRSPAHPSPPRCALHPPR